MARRWIPLRWLIAACGAAMCLAVCAFLHPVRAEAATITVTANADDMTPNDGTVSLREAVNAINTGGTTDPNIVAQTPGVFGANDTIRFAIPGGAATITVASSLTLRSDVAILGPVGGPSVTVSGGGAAVVFVVNMSVTARIDTLTVADGRAVGGGGGIANFGTLTIANCIFTNNRASNNGGALFNAGTATVTRSLFTGNTASNGGGAIRNADTIAVTNSTFTTNGALNGGAFDGDHGDTTLTNVTITGNTATGSGGGIVNQGNVTLINTLVTENTASIGPDLSGPMTSGGHNLVGVTTGSTGITNGVNGDRVGATPLLAPLADYTGPTQTFALLPGSPAIGAGDAAICARTSGAAPVGGVDQRGVARPGATCDIGAFQSQGFALAVVSGTPQSVLVNTPFAPLVVAVANTHAEPVVGGVVTFTGPASGAGIASSPATATIGAGGQATVTPSANGTAGGPYAVLASASGAIPVTFSLTNNIITIAPATLADGARNLPYPAVTLSATRGTAPYTFAVTSGALPPGLTLAGDILSGTPTAVGVYTCTIAATDATHAVGTRQYTLAIAPTPLARIAVTAPGGATTASVKVGQSLPLAAMGTYADGSVQPLAGCTWLSSNPAIAQADIAGTVTGQSPGATTISCTSGGVTGQIAVTVAPPTPIGIQPAPAPAARVGIASGEPTRPLPPSR